MRPCGPTSPSRLRLTAYAAWQVAAVRAVTPGAVLHPRRRRARGDLVGLLFLLVTMPACRWIANRAPPDGRPTCSGRRSPTSTATPRPASDRPGDRLGAGPDDLARPRLAAGRVHRRVRGLADRRAAPDPDRDRGALVVRRRPAHEARSVIDRGFLSYGQTEVLEQRVQVLTETRAEAVDHSAAELRRIERDLHDGAQARLVALSMSLGMADEPDRQRPGAGPADGRGGPRRPARPRSATCGPWSAASTRRCSPTAGWPARSRRWRWTWRCRSTYDGRAARPAAGAGRVGGLLRGRRVPGQHRQALRARTQRLDPTLDATAAGVLRVVVGDDGAAARIRTPGPACGG